MITRYTAVLDKSYCLKHAIEAVLVDEKMQNQSLRFMRYVSVWLLRVASRKDYTPEKEFQ
jgi:ubiquitin conjugation factor E4 B